MKNLGIALAVTTALTLYSNASGVQENNKNIDINQYIKYRSSVTSDKSVSKINIRLRKGLVKPGSDIRIAQRDLKLEATEADTIVAKVEEVKEETTAVQENTKIEKTEVKEEAVVHIVEAPETKPSDLSLSGETVEKPVKEDKVEAEDKTETEVKDKVEDKTETEVKEDTVKEEAVVKEEPAVKEDKEVEVVVEEKETEEVEDNSYSVSGFTIDTLNIRSKNNTSSRIIGVLRPGERVQGVHENGWIKINYNGLVGYVSESYVEAKSESEEAVGVETEPVVEEEPVIEETPEEEVVIEEPKEETPVETTGGMQSMISDAYSLLGSPYVFGASSIGTGFDCSGLTSYLYQKHFGVSIGRVTTNQVYAGYEVGVGNMQVGDLICFQNNWSDVCDHVAIYAGDGVYIHAADETRGVVTDSIYGSYFQNNVVSVRRVIN